MANMHRSAVDGVRRGRAGLCAMRDLPTSQPLKIDAAGHARRAPKYRADLSLDPGSRSCRAARRVARPRTARQVFAARRPPPGRGAQGPGRDGGRCLVSTDDEAYTYNKRINRIAIDPGAPDDPEGDRARGAPRSGSRPLSTSISHNDPAAKRACSTASAPTPLPPEGQARARSMRSHVLRKMVPLRQIEAAELMVVMNNFTVSYAKSLLAATPQAAAGRSAASQSRSRVLPSEQIALHGARVG